MQGTFRTTPPLQSAVRPLRRSPRRGDTACRAASRSRACGRLPGPVFGGRGLQFDAFAIYLQALHDLDRSLEVRYFLHDRSHLLTLLVSKHVPLLEIIELSEPCVECELVKVGVLLLVRRVAE